MLSGCARTGTCTGTGTVTGTGPHLPEDRCTAHGVDLRDGVQEGLAELEPLLGRQQDARARLADALQHGHRLLQVADVQHGQLELDEPKVAGAFGHAHAASLARVELVRDAQPAVEHAVDHRCAPWLLVAAVGDHLVLGKPLDLLVAHQAKLHMPDPLAEPVLLEHLPRPQRKPGRHACHVAGRRLPPSVADGVRASMIVADGVRASPSAADGPSVAGRPRAPSSRSRPSCEGGKDRDGRLDLGADRGKSF